MITIIRFQTVVEFSLAGLRSFSFPRVADERQNIARITGRAPDSKRRPYWFSRGGARAISFPIATRGVRLYPWIPVYSPPWTRTHWRSRSRTWNTRHPWNGGLSRRASRRKCSAVPPEHIVVVVSNPLVRPLVVYPVLLLSVYLRIAFANLMLDIRQNIDHPRIIRIYYRYIRMSEKSRNFYRLYIHRSSRDSIYLPPSRRKCFR